jgi:DNA-binding transcriptional ArsR family regulator
MFHGSDYCPALDYERLTNQINRIEDFMKDGRWRTLDEISYNTGAPQASVSAQLRNLRKIKYGGYVIERRRCGKRENGLFEYRMVL